MLITRCIVSDIKSFVRMRHANQNPFALIKTNASFLIPSITCPENPVACLKWWVFPAKISVVHLKPTRRNASTPNTAAVKNEGMVRVRWTPFVPVFLFHFHKDECVWKDASVSGIVNVVVRGHVLLEALVYTTTNHNTLKEKHHGFRKHSVIMTVLCSKELCNLKSNRNKQNALYAATRSSRTCWRRPCVRQSALCFEYILACLSRSRSHVIWCGQSEHDMKLNQTTLYAFQTNC